MATDKPRVVLQFNNFDFRHRKVLEILRARPRNMTDMVVNAILHFVSCPEAEQEFNKDAIRKIVKDVIQDMVKSGELVGQASGTALTNEDTNDLGDIMSAFR